MTEPTTAITTWEYTSVVWCADIENEGAREYIRERWPNWRPPRYTPSTLIPALNRYGEQGWELVSMRPILVNADHAAIYPTGGLGLACSADRGNDYLCTFRREKRLTQEPPADSDEGTETPWSDLYASQSDRI